MLMLALALLNVRAFNCDSLPSKCALILSLLHKVILDLHIGQLIALSMGEKGVVTRILASKYGGFLTFAALSSGQESAPGQPALHDLISMYRIREHSAETKVFGIIGNPIKHSRSPVLHNNAMASAGFDGVYVPLLVDDMDRFMSTFSDLDWAGYSVTIPHKVSVGNIASITIFCPQNAYVCLSRDGTQQTVLISYDLSQYLELSG
jgi:hypothetical protein